MRGLIAVLAVALMGGPAMADYRILSDDRFESRRVVAVELLERARAAELGLIADAVKSRDAKAYERTVINFYLPSMNLGDGSWATVSYSPERLTSINGLTLEEELAFMAKVRADKRDRVGSWIASSPAIAGEVTIFRKDGRKYVEWSLRSGLKSVDEVTETRTWRGRRFDIRAGSKTHFLVNADNNLEIRDFKGLIATGEHIVANKSARRLSALARSRSRLGAPLPPEAETHQITVRRAPPARIYAPGATEPDSIPTGPVARAIERDAGGRASRRDVGGYGAPRYVAPVAGQPEVSNPPPENVVRAASPPKARVVRRKKRTAGDLFMSNLTR